MAKTVEGLSQIERDALLPHYVQFGKALKGYLARKKITIETPLEPIEIYLFNPERSEYVLLLVRQFMSIVSVMLLATPTNADRPMTTTILYLAQSADTDWDFEFPHNVYYLSDIPTDPKGLRPGDPEETALIISVGNLLDTSEK